jgi:hypothetical protein
MEPKPRPQSPQITPRSPAVLRPEGGLLARHGNTILTIALLAAAAALAYRWWARSADTARQAIVAQLEQARQSVDQLHDPRLIGMPPADLMNQVRVIQATVTGTVSDVITKAEDPAVKARALVVRGDLNWAIANLPELPGAATQPALRPDPPADDLLRQASEAYSAAIGVSGASPQTVAAARLGLAAVAEDHGDWTAAKEQLQAVADATDPTAAALAATAKEQLADLPSLEKPSYLAPPSGVPVTTQPATTQATTKPSSQPSTRSTTQPTTAAVRARPMAVVRPSATTRPSTRVGR